MTLTLEVTGSHGDQLGSARRKIFRGTGGTIGRVPGNDWVLPDPHVSSNHAVIRCTNGAYYIEDTSSNGTFLNSSDHRLESRRPYQLQAGDSIFIVPYEIRVGMDEDERAAPPGGIEALGYDVGGSPASFLEDSVLRPVSPSDFFDPLPPEPPADVKRAEHLQGHSPVHAPYQPPRVIAAEPPPVRSAGPIPTHYNPLDPNVSRIEAIPALQPPAPPAPPVPPVVRPKPHPGHHRSSDRQLPPVEPAGPAQPATPRSSGEGTLADVLEGAVVHGVDVTPELARDFGRILLVVVSGLMAVLKARQDIKDEFRLGVTTMQPKANNPLKFSANVEDALHNLLVKRNQAYLPPVEAFEDAFGDVRNHQMAMLAGIRAAFEAMLADFDPDRLQAEFDRQIKKGGALVKMPAKLRYWDLYSEKIRDMVSDADASFRALFGEEFAAAYEAQLKRLKARGRSEQS